MRTIDPSAQDDPAGTLDLQEEERHRIFHPEHLETAAGERAALDLGAIPVGPERAAAHHAGDLPAGEVALEVTEVDDQLIARREIDRMDERRLLLARAASSGS